MVDKYLGELYPTVNFKGSPTIISSCVKVKYDVITTGFTGKRHLIDFTWTLKDIEGEVTKEHKKLV